LLLDHTQKKLADVESLGGISLVVGDEESRARSLNSLTGNRELAAKKSVCER
jgi:hypothetical protein